MEHATEDNVGRLGIMAGQLLMELYADNNEAFHERFGDLTDALRNMKNDQSRIVMMQLFQTIAAANPQVCSAFQSPSLTLYLARILNHHLSSFVHFSTNIKNILRNID